MRLVIQRVTQAKVEIDGRLVGQCAKGFMILVGAQVGDTMDDVKYCVEKTANLRIFEDDAGKMNRSIVDIGGSVLAISQFTLLGDARHGRRPGFTDAEHPETARALYDAFCEGLRALSIHTEKGVFGADMQVTLTNDGPVTMLIDSRKVF